MLVKVSDNPALGFCYCVLYQGTSQRSGLLAWEASLPREFPSQFTTAPEVMLHQAKGCDVGRAQVC